MPVLSQTTDSASNEDHNVRDSKLYHILFDDAERAPHPIESEMTVSISIPIDSAGGLNLASQHPGQTYTRYEGGMTQIRIADSRDKNYFADTADIARFVDIRCSDDPEYAEIERISDDTLRIDIFKRDRSSGSKIGEPLFTHIFVKNRTKEVRLQLRGGDDYAIVRGTVNSSLLVRVIGGEGTDELVDSSHVKGHLFSILPIEHDAKHTFFYGEPNETNFIYSTSTEVNSTPYIETDTLRDWGHELFFWPWLGFTSDQGIFIGAATAVTQYDFRCAPFDELMRLRAGITTGSGRYQIEYDEKFTHRLGAEISVGIHASSHDVLNFFGYGNVSTFDKKKYSSDGYRFEQHQIALSHGYLIHIIENTSVWGSAEWKYTRTEDDPIKDSSVILKRYRYGEGSFTTAQFSGGIVFDSRDQPRSATKGIFASFGSYWTPEIGNNSFAYTRLQADIRGYLSTDFLTPFTLALRMKVEKIFGEHPFYAASFLGGANDLRGYYQNRFAGEESLLASGELRVQLGSTNIYVPGKFGISIFSDVGRVYVDNDFSNDWHLAFGAGLWYAPVSMEHTVSLTIAHSPESTLLYLTTGFTF